MPEKERERETPRAAVRPTFPLCRAPWEVKGPTSSAVKSEEKPAEVAALRQSQTSGAARRVNINSMAAASARVTVRVSAIQ